MNRAIFLDRDGTLNFDEGYTHKVEDLRIIPKVVEGLKKLQKAGYKLIIITGQSGIGRGYYTEQDYFNFRKEMHKQLKEQGIFIDAEYFCPHTPDDNCNCRKPKTRLLEQASEDFNLNLKECWMIGDKTCDIKTGENAGCRTILVKTGEAGEDRHFGINPTFIAKNLYEASLYILNNKKE